MVATNAYLSTSNGCKVFHSYYLTKADKVSTIVCFPFLQMRKLGLREIK